jgi:hypothetical protein
MWSKTPRPVTLVPTESVEPKNPNPQEATPFRGIVALVVLVAVVGIILSATYLGNRYIEKQRTDQIAVQTPTLQPTAVLPATTPVATPIHAQPQPTTVISSQSQAGPVDGSTPPAVAESESALGPVLLAVNQPLNVQASQFHYWPINIPSESRGAEVSGSFRVQGGLKNDGEVMIMDAINLENWKNGNTANLRIFYDSGLVTVARLHVILTPGSYVLVLSNAKGFVNRVFSPAIAVRQF